MEQRVLGRTGRRVGAVGLGTWQIGGSWGDVSEDDAFGVLAAAVESGVNLFDTADVYGDGRSEQLIARFLHANPGTDVFVATKMGRRDAQTLDNYSMANFRAWNERSLRNLQTDRLDLVQLHCPPTEVFQSDEVFDNLDSLVEEGKIAHYGVSVETVEQALIAIARPNVATVQIIFNAFRQKPLDEALPAAEAAGVGILARVPLASGLLTGKLNKDSTFAADDHRNFNRNGESFDVGETFSGVDYEKGLAAVEALRALVPDDASMAQWALRWILMHSAVSVVIPGARNQTQAQANGAAAGLAALSPDDMNKVQSVYDEFIKPDVQGRW